MPQQKFHCGDCKSRLPDLTSDMCRLLSYRSLNGLVRERESKWRNEEEGKSSGTHGGDKVRHKWTALGDSALRTEEVNVSNSL